MNPEWTGEIVGAIVGVVMGGGIGFGAWGLKTMFSKNGKSKIDGWRECPDYGKLDSLSQVSTETNTIVKELKADTKDLFPRVGKLETGIAVLSSQIKKNADD